MFVPNSLKFFLLVFLKNLFLVLGIGMGSGEIYCFQSSLLIIKKKKILTTIFKKKTTVCIRLHNLFSLIFSSSFINVILPSLLRILLIIAVDVQLVPLTINAGCTGKDVTDTD